ncbi:hypothetical protein Forpe1208_v001616 [Fusarium oxysporum f. sp. rapae]|uniref:Uncharacterized protein n=1 Tax=Fusarium oxysporum f. sp. rapae TaxID=485398 RepID=A0A8J5PKX9_FUSOX|nr:hypothetical protein Forpe1208_v001616 [Fusarium oxysporum f. sp. rapae]
MGISTSKDRMKKDEKRHELFRQSLDDAVAKSSSEIGNSATATLGSVGKMGKRDDFLSVPGSYQRSLKRPRVEEKEKETKAVRDKELKALEVKIKALEENEVPRINNRYKRKKSEGHGVMQNPEASNLSVHRTIDNTDDGFGVAKKDGNSIGNDAPPTTTKKKRTHKPRKPIKDQPREMHC